MNIDASLQSFMDPYINIARATVAKGASDKKLVNTVLLTFGGLGLAKAVKEKEGTKWIPTDQLNEFTDPAELPADLTPVMLAFKDRSGEPEMTKSLRMGSSGKMEFRRLRNRSAYWTMFITLTINVRATYLALRQFGRRAAEVADHSRTILCPTIMMP